MTPAPKEGYVPSLSLLARQKYDLVIGNNGAEQDPGGATPHFFGARSIDRVATEFPETRFAIIDVAHDDLAHRPKNVLGLVFTEEQAGYLAGHLAALVLELSPGEEVISSVGGQRVPAVERYIAGYQAGARRANPRVTALNTYTDDFIDPVKGRSVALSQIAKGSRVVFQVASACGLGALEVASERRVWGIGVDVDQSHLGQHILTSAVKRMDVAIFDTIEELARGTLETGRTSRFSLRNGGVGLGTINAGCLARSRPSSRTSGPRWSPGRSRSRARSHSALALYRNPDDPVPRDDVRWGVAMLDRCAGKLGGDQLGEHALEVTSTARRTSSPGSSGRCGSSAASTVAAIVASSSAPPSDHAAGDGENEIPRSAPGSARDRNRARIARLAWLR